MRTCKEYTLDDLMAIVAIPVANISASSPSSPVNHLAPTLSKSGFSPSMTGAITIGQTAATSGGVLIPIKPGTGKAKDDESDSVAGRLHTVSVSCEADDRDLTADSRGETVLDHLLRLERTPSHLLLTFRGGQRAFVAATEDTYTCEVERNGAKTSVSFKIENLMGIQLIIA